jgi:hypothetical protein
MKKIRRFLRKLSAQDWKSNIILLALVPTAWAVYTGLTMTPTWPMPWIIAIPGALALLFVSVGVAGYISRVSEYNKSLKRYDALVHNIPVWYGWFLLVLTTTAEITLALLVNIIPGVRTYSVIAFPMLGLSGIFVYSLRSTLEDAIEERDKGRLERDIKRKDAKRASANTGTPTKSKPDPRRTCPQCGAVLANANAYSAHVRWKHPKQGE